MDRETLKSGRSVRRQRLLHQLQHQRRRPRLFRHLRRPNSRSFTRWPLNTPSTNGFRFTKAAIHIITSLSLRSSLSQTNLHALSGCSSSSAQCRITKSARWALTFSCVVRIQRTATGCWCVTFTSCTSNREAHCAWNCLSTMQQTVVALLSRSPM